MATASATQPPIPMLSVVKAEEASSTTARRFTTGDSVLLVVEDDPHYARILAGIARGKGFKGIVAQRGQLALTLAREYRPTAITLDVFLPDMLGWTVLSNLKLDPATRHIPVQMLSVEEERQHGLSHGAFSYLAKPATTDELEEAMDRLELVAPHTKRLLVIEDNDCERASIVELLGHDDIEVERPRPEPTRSPRCARASSTVVCRPAPARHDGLRASGAAASGACAAQHSRSSCSPGRSWRPKSSAGCERRQEHRAQGRAVAGAVARRDRAVPAPRDRRIFPKRSGE